MAIVFGTQGGILTGTDADDLLQGGAGDELLRGLGGNDRLVAGPGDDRLDGGGGNDRLDGGPGSDTALYGGRASGYLVVALDATSVRVSDLNPADGNDGDDILVGVEHLEFADGVRGVAGTNSAPLASDDDLTGAAGNLIGSVRIPTSDLLANDRDPDGDALRVVSVDNALNGSVVLFDGVVLFQGIAQAGEPAAFRYTIADAHGATASATAFLAVAPAVQGPSAFFGAFDAVHGDQLWALGQDGPEPVSSAGFGAGRLAVEATDRDVFFARQDGDGSYGIWRFDGAEAVRLHVSSTPAGPAQTQLTAADGRLFFAADGADGIGWELRATAPDHLVAFDIQPGPGSSFPLELQAVGGQVFFSADDGVSGREPWLASGSQAVALGDLAAGPASSFPSDFTPFRDAVYFAADDGVHGRELWKWDGDRATLAADVERGPAGGAPHLLTAAVDALYFVADGEALWRHDGATTSAVPVGPVSAITALAASGNTLYVATAEGGGGGLWMVDGQSVTRLAGPTELKTPPAELTPIDPQLYFTAADGRGEELWRWDGNSLAAIDLSAGPQGSAPRDLTAVDGKLIFSAAGGQDGRELWIADGQSVARADGDPFNGGYDPHDIVLTPADWPFT